MSFFNSRREFLFSIGALNFFYPALLTSSELNPDVVVVGAGAAGLAATGRLLENGVPTIWVGADNRIGGRTYTDNNIFGVPYDIGAHWIHNAKSSPYYKYGRSIKAEGFDIYKPPTAGGEQKYRIYDGKRDVTNSKSERDLWKIYNRLKQSITNVGLKGYDIAASEAISDKGSKWFETAHHLIGPYDMAKDLKDISCVDFTNYPAWSLSWFCKQGYGALVKHRWRNIPVKLNTSVKEIHYGSKNSIEIELNKGKLRAKKCIITVSNGVLASNRIKFVPSLSVNKVAAFNNISMGVYNRVAILFKNQFFSEVGVKDIDSYIYYRLRGSNDSPKGIGCLMNISGSNLCFFDNGGGFAKELEAAGKATQIDFTLNELKSIFGSKIEKYLVKVHATQWGKNHFTLGSYASADPGCAYLRKHLLFPEKESLFFAGEATAVEYATVSGAHRSGIRVADEVIKALKKDNS